jgi:hypothetical protein
MIWNLVRDQGVGGSNPLSPTIYFQSLASLRRPITWCSPRCSSLQMPYRCSLHANRRVQDHLIIDFHEAASLCKLFFVLLIISAVAVLCPASIRTLVEPLAAAPVHVGVLPFRGCCHLQRDLHPVNLVGPDLTIFRSHPQHGFSSISTNRFFPS